MSTNPGASCTTEKPFDPRGTSCTAPASTKTGVVYASTEEGLFRHPRDAWHPCPLRAKDTRMRAMIFRAQEDLNDWTLFSP